MLGISQDTEVAGVFQELSEQVVKDVLPLSRAVDIEETKRSEWEAERGGIGNSGNFALKFGGPIRGDGIQGVLLVYRSLQCLSINCRCRCINETLDVGTSRSLHKFECSYGVGLEVVDEIYRRVGNRGMSCQVEDAVHAVDQLKN